jgi:hypothetical protein
MMCCVWLSEEKVPFALYINNRLVFITEAESVYCAVRTVSLYKTDAFRPSNVNHLALQCNFQSSSAVFVEDDITCPYVTFQ